MEAEFTEPAERTVTFSMTESEAEQLHADIEALWEKSSRQRGSSFWGTYAALSALDDELDRIGVDADYPEPRPCQ